MKATSLRKFLNQPGPSSQHLNPSLKKQTNPEQIKQIKTSQIFSYIAVHSPLKGPCNTAIQELLYLEDWIFESVQNLGFPASYHCAAGSVTAAV